MTVSVICWLWDDHGPRAGEFKAKHVNVLQKMAARYLSIPHRFVCVADKPDGFSSGVEFFKTPEAAVKVGQLRTPEAGRFPSCYRRLWMFSSEAKALGDVVLLLDIDVVILQDFANLFGAADFTGWRPFRDWGRKLRFGGGIYLLRTGTRTHVWEDFKGAPSIAAARQADYRGSDQAWISYKLAESEPYYARDSGIYSIRDFATLDSPPPADARIVQMNGPPDIKPWRSNLPWIKEHWH